MLIENGSTGKASASASKTPTTTSAPDEIRFQDFDPPMIARLAELAGTPEDLHPANEGRFHAMMACGGALLKVDAPNMRRELWKLARSTTPYSELSETQIRTLILYRDLSHSLAILGRRGQ